MPISTGAILGAAALSSIGGGLLNAVGMNSQNRAAREQYQQSMNFGREQTYLNSYLNSPAVQVRKFKQAGINPALAMYSGADAGNVSMPSAPASNASVGTMDYSGLPSVASALANGLSQLDVNESTIDLQNSMSEKAHQDAISSAIDNMYKDEDWQQSLAGKKFQNILLENQGKLAAVQQEFEARTLGHRIEQQEWQAENWRATAASSLIAAKYADQEHSQALKQGLAAIFQSYATGRASLKMASNDAMRLYAMYGATDGQRSEFFRQTMDNLREIGNETRSKTFVNWLTPNVRGIPTPNGAISATETAKRDRVKNRSRKSSTSYSSGGVR